MAIWGKNDNAANTPNFGTSLVNLTSNSANKAAVFGNTTQGAFKNNNTPMKKAVGIFGVDATEAGISNGAVLNIQVTYPGSGYSANATVTLSGNATANAQANSTGKIAQVNISSAGSGYTSKPSVTIAAPTPQAFNSNTDVIAADDFIALSPQPFETGDLITYTVAAGNTALVGLVSGSSYYIRNANSSGVKLSTSKTGAVISLTEGLTESGHSLTGQTATAEATISGTKGKGVTPGWVVRTEGSGGRAGRVQHETLVAMRQVIGDASDDGPFKDS